MQKIYKFSIFRSILISKCLLYIVFEIPIHPCRKIKMDKVALISGKPQLIIHVPFRRLGVNYTVTEKCRRGT